MSEGRDLPLLICTDRQMFCVASTMRYVRTDGGSRAKGRDGEGPTSILVGLQDTRIVWTNVLSHHLQCSACQLIFLLSLCPLAYY